jgi:predicted ATPase
MATDLEATTNEGETPAARPSLKIVGLHIKGLKSIGSLDLPEDGLGWDGTIPDIIMVGGINGSGKTTLLEFLASSFEYLGRALEMTGDREIPIQVRAEQAFVDFRLSIDDDLDEEFRFVVGDREFFEEHKTGNWFGFQYEELLHAPGLCRFQVAIGDQLDIAILATRLIEKLKTPGVVYFPSEGRSLINPDTQFQFTGKVAEDLHFVYRWRPPKDGGKSDPLIERIYNVRWNDLSAKEEGRITEANGFESYSQAFNRFFEGRKRLKWDHGELVVETKSGAVHDLSELSSGEKQVILFMGELLHRWRPGSLILIDEPELHLHESYQTKLWEALLDWQKERGGQVIVATQSGHLFRISKPGNKVLLSRQSR